MTRPARAYNREYYKIESDAAIALRDANRRGWVSGTVNTNPTINLGRVSSEGELLNRLRDALTEVTEGDDEEYEGLAEELLEEIDDAPDEAPARVYLPPTDIKEKNKGIWDVERRTSAPEGDYSFQVRGYGTYSSLKKRYAYYACSCGCIYHALWAGEAGKLEKQIVCDHIKAVLDYVKTKEATQPRPVSSKSKIQTFTDMKEDTF